MVLSHTLVIVESPAKCPKLKAILGNTYDVQASCGHLLDIPAQLQWMRAHNLDPNTVPYNPISAKKGQIAKLRQCAKNASRVLIAADMDREGEAIGFHICSVLGIDPSTTERILFDQITPDAIQHAVAHPVAMRTDMYRAQQARRVVDLLFGYTISPRLWHIAPKLSAGRCQSPTLCWLHERQQQFMGFQPGASHYDVSAMLQPGDLVAKQSISHTTKETASDALRTLEKLRTWRIEQTDIKLAIQQPPLAFTTSALQQECHQKWRWAPKHTMAIAQKLYENGFITYMRTDCTRLSDTFIDEATKVIVEQFGAAYLKNTSVTKTTKTSRKNKSNVQAQEAHEPIRPTDATRLRLADAERQTVSDDAAKLYTLIHRRALASLMAACKTEVQTFSLKDEPAKREELVATWKGVQFAGFRAWEYSDAAVPPPPFTCPYAVDDPFAPEYYTAQEKHKSRPRPYSAGDVVKLLEQKGVGRPSTYCSILERLEQRKYIDTVSWTDALKNMPKKTTCTIHVEMENTPPEWETRQTEAALANDIKGRYHVTPLGEKVATYLIQHVDELVGQTLTEKLEGELDAISKGTTTYAEVVGAYRDALEQLPPAQYVTDGGTGGRRQLGESPDGVHVVLRTKNGEAVAFFPHTKGDKPRFATLPNGVAMADVTLDDAVLWLQNDTQTAQKQLTPLTTFKGETVYAKTGKFGHYLQCGTRTCKFMDDTIDLDTVTAEHAALWLDGKTGDGVTRTIDEVFSIRRSKGGGGSSSIFLMKKQSHGKKPLFAPLPQDARTDAYTVADCKLIFQMQTKSTKPTHKTNPKPKPKTKPKPKPKTKPKPKPKTKQTKPNSNANTKTNT
jgi:DNA topoisomerase-1